MEYKEKIIEMINEIESEDILLYIYKIVEDIRKEDIKNDEER